jgi:hypothetical protein
MRRLELTRVVKCQIEEEERGSNRGLERTAY